MHLQQLIEDIDSTELETPSRARVNNVAADGAMSPSCGTNVLLQTLDNQCGESHPTKTYTNPTTTHCESVAWI